MRVLQLSSRPRSEHGATAVLVSVLAVVLVGLAAFTLDFGRAYVSKRTLQNAADAGSLAAAAYYADKAGTCTELTTGSQAATHESAARTKAEAIVGESRPGNTTFESFEVACNGDDELTVDVTLNGSTPVGIGGVFGLDSITAQRAAQATLEVQEIGNGVRPYMVCSDFAPDLSTLPTNWVKVDFPSGSDTGGNCPHDSGNWFTVDCPHPGNGSNGNPGLADATRYGCDHTHPVRIVENQDFTSATSLYNSLRAACPSTSTAMQDYDPDCLTSNPGNVDAAQVMAAWNTLIGKNILLPVFCKKGTSVGTCDPAGWVSGGGGGNNTMYPVHKFAAVKVCGYHWGNVKHSGAYSTADPLDRCAGADATAGGNQNYLLLAFTAYQTSGSSNDSDCALASECDSGARQTRLTQ